MTATAGSLGLSTHQYANAKGIIAAVKARGWSARAAIIAVETALTESGMRLIASANVPDSINYPHDLLSWTWDGLGHDHASCGMFQQQTGWAWALAGTTTMGSANGWGTPAELMNAQTSTTKFLNALARVNWQGGTRWGAAQAVQGSAFSDGSNYARQDGWAYQIVTGLWSGGVVTPVVKSVVKLAPAHAPDSGVTKPLAALRYTVRQGDTLGAIAARHHTSWQILAKLNRLANPNKIRIGQILRMPSVVAKAAPKSKVRIVGHYTVRRGDTLTSICAMYKPAWITPYSVSHLNNLSNPNHLVIGAVLRVGG